jgi:hypothetical protein
MVLSIPRFVKVLKLNDNKYYTDFINKKQCIYSFSNLDSAQECALYAANHKHLYSRYPIISENKHFIELKKTIPGKRKPVKKILEDELCVYEENLEGLIIACSIINLGLIIVDRFDFQINNDNINNNLKYSYVELDKTKEYNHIDFLNSILKYK